MAQLGAKVLGVGLGLEIVVGLAPIGDGVDHAMDQLGDAALALGGPHLAVKVFTGDDVGGGLGPIDRDFDVPLLEDDRAFVVADGGGPSLPVELIVGRLSGLQPGRKVALERNPFAIFLLLDALWVFRLSA